MVDHFLFYDFLLIALLWLGAILSERWARTQAATGPTTRKRATPLPKHFRNPKPFPGLTHKPSCAAWKGQKAKVSFASAPGGEYEGELSRIYFF